MIPDLIVGGRVNILSSRPYSSLLGSTHTHICVLVSYLNDTKPQPTKGMINRHRIIFQFLVSREISPYHCLERKFYRGTKIKDRGPC